MTAYNPHLNIALPATGLARNGGPIREVTRLAGIISDKKIAEYTAAKCAWVSLEEARKSKAVRLAAAIHAYAGKNPMEKYRTCISEGGLRGAAQVFDNLMSVEKRKHGAGEWIVTARECRARGDVRAALQCLERASLLRRYPEAKYRAQMKRVAS